MVIRRPTVAICEGAPNRLLAQFASVLLACSAPQYLGSAVASDENLRGASVQSLPRAGYQPHEIRLGATTFAPSLLIDATNNNNIFARSTGVTGDTIFSFAPSVAIRKTTSKLTLSSNIFANILRFAKHAEENVNTFGLDGSAGYKLNHATSATVNASYQRVYLRRIDPQPPNPGLPPALIDATSVGLGYQFQPHTFGISSGIGISKTAYRDPIFADRNLTTYHGSVRGLYAASHHLNLLVEGFLKPRDFATSVDLGGVNRDSVTKGLNLGATLDISGHWTGDISIGLFHAEPHDPSLRSFSGLGMNGSVTWHPQTRTSVSLDVFSGDVATIQSGAYGRTDMNVSLEIEQEAHHNLLLHANFAHRDANFRGGGLEKVTLVTSAGAEYLLNGRASMTIDFSRTRRTTNTGNDEFVQDEVRIGTRLRY